MSDLENQQQSADDLAGKIEQLIIQHFSDAGMNVYPKLFLLCGEVVSMDEDARTEPIMAARVGQTWMETLGIIKYAETFGQTMIGGMIAAQFDQPDENS